MAKVYVVTFGWDYGSSRPVKAFTLKAEAEAFAKAAEGTDEDHEVYRPGALWVDDTGKRHAGDIALVYELTVE